MQLMESCPISFFNSVFELPLGVIVLSVLILLQHLLEREKSCHFLSKLLSEWRDRTSGGYVVVMSVRPNFC